MNMQPETESRWAKLTQAQRTAKRTDKMARLATWRPEELVEVLSSWAPQEVKDLWDLLKPVFVSMCYRFGTMRPNNRVTRRGIRLHQQMKRLDKIQEAARKMGVA